MADEAEEERLLVEVVMISSELGCGEVGPEAVAGEAGDRVPMTFVG